MSSALRLAGRIVRAAVITAALGTGAVAVTYAFVPEHYCGDEDCNLNNPLIACDPDNNVCPFNPGGYYTKCCEITS